MKPGLLTCFFFMLAMSSGFSENEKLELDEDVWKRNIENLEYAPEKKPDAEDPAPVEETENSTLPDLSGFKYLAYIAVFAIIIVLLILILRNMRPVQSISKERIEANTIEEAEENLPMVALTKIYQEALDVSDYKRALRIKFLMILQSLIDKQMIVWKKRKTNEQYLIEISDVQIKDKFRSAVNLFDDVWYGETKISSAQYENAIQGLDALRTRIGSNAGQ